MSSVQLATIRAAGGAAGKLGGDCKYKKNFVSAETHQI